VTCSWSAEQPQKDKLKLATSWIFKKKEQNGTSWSIPLKGTSKNDTILLTLWAPQPQTPTKREIT
jgi:hypothetical protein